MLDVLLILSILGSILLVLVVLVQNPKGGGISSDFGSATQLGGVKRSSEMIEKLTWGLAAAIMAVCLATAPYTTSKGGPAQKKGVDVNASPDMNVQVPATPAGGAPAQ